MANGGSGTEQRALILVFDSLGIGASPDAEAFGDEGANTLGRILDTCASGNADVPGLRQGPLEIPFLERHGLLHALAASDNRYKPPAFGAGAAWGYAEEKGVGKDTPSGHWEIAGVPVMEEWGVFPEKVPCFPQHLVADLVSAAGLPGILGNCHASGTEIIRRLGAEHISSGQPICYTSVDSVFQIAAHEQHFGLERLYQVCEIAKQLTEPLNIARVIARPFTGEDSDNFVRTGNRRDFTTPPPADTLLDKVVAAGGEVVSVGKIADIFAHRGITRTVKGKDNMELFDQLLDQMAVSQSGSLLFVNFVDFDMLYGHRRDIPGYAAALETIDARMPEFMACLRPGDLALITSDHGCDPGWPGSDHTRENVPVVFLSKQDEPRAVGKLDGFARMGDILAEHLSIA